MAFVDDIPTNLSPPSAAPTPRKLGNYRHFVQQERQDIYSNAFAYVNRRVESKRYPDAQLRKILKTAIFIPAHSSRFKAGEFRIETMKYFVVHRPGRYPPACTLLNTLREFGAKNKVASTQFVIGFNGELVQMVDLGDMAIHTGTSRGLVFNSNSVGVELEGAVGEKLTLAQYQTLAKLIRVLHDINGFLPDPSASNFITSSRTTIVGHSEILPQIKTDPGPNFNYYFLASLIRDVPATTPSEIFRSPFNPLFSIEQSIQNILTQATNPGSTGAMALLNSTTHDALAVQRSMLLGLAGRTDIAFSAATVAARKAKYMDRILAEQLQLIEMLGLTWAETPTDNSDSFFDYSSGTYPGEETL